MLLAAACWPAAPTAATELSVRLDRLEAPGIAAGPIDVRVTDGARATLHLTIGEVSVENRHWRNVRVACADFSWGVARIDCRNGVAEVGTRIPLSFTYRMGDQTLELVLWPGAEEAWTLKARLGESKPSLSLEIKNGSLSRLAPWLPAHWPKLAAGSLSGVITLDLLDEPFADLDPAGVEWLVGWIGQHRDTRVVLFTHHGASPVAPNGELPLQ